MNDNPDNNDEPERSKDNSDDELGCPIEDYYKPHINQQKYNGLPLPFGHLVVPHSGDTEGNRLGITPTTALVDLSGDWKVIHETNKGGYPVVLVRKTGDAAVAATLSTYGHNQRYRNGLIGYACEVGTFSIAEVRQSIAEVPQPGSWLNQITHTNPEQDLVAQFQKPESKQPFLWQQNPDRRWTGSAFVCCRLDDHQPWPVLKKSRLDGFKQLRTRYKKAATAIEKQFNPTPPEQRGPSTIEGSRNPEKALELMKIIKKEEDSE